MSTSKDGEAGTTFPHPMSPASTPGPLLNTVEPQEPCMHAAPAAAASSSSTPAAATSAPAASTSAHTAPSPAPWAQGPSSSCVLLPSSYQLRSHPVETTFSRNSEDGSCSSSSSSSVDGDGHIPTPSSRPSPTARLNPLAKDFVPSAGPSCNTRRGEQTDADIVVTPGLSADEQYGELQRALITAPSFVEKAKVRVMRVLKLPAVCTGGL